MTKKKPEFANDIQTSKQPINDAAQARIERLRLNQLRTDGDTHCRTGIDAFQVDEYVAAIRRGDKFPPVRARFDEQENCYWLWDGFHRLAAAKEYGAKTIEVEVSPGSQRDAVLDGILANATHGLSRTNADKRVAVSTLLSDSEWAKWTNREIARQCKVSHELVAQVRESLSGKRCQIASKAKRNGKTYVMNTSRIGITQNIAPEVRELICSTDLVENRKGLKRLASCVPDEQVRAAKIIASGATDSVENAILKARRQAQHTLLEQELPSLRSMGKYRTIMIDPPWDLGDGGRFSPSSHYKVMPFEDIERLEIGEAAADDCHLYLWVVQSILPKAFGLIEKWGFEYKNILTWVKTDKEGKPRISSWSYFGNCIEFILFAVRGNVPPQANNLSNALLAPRPKHHSEKPNKAYELAEKMSLSPRLEMFSRTTRPGWDEWGDQVGLLGERSEASEAVLLDYAA